MPSIGTNSKSKSSSHKDADRPTPYRQKLKQAMREQILNSAEYVFAEKGFGSAKIEEIASRAGVAVGTIYLHFDNKETLYFTLLNTRIDQLVALIEKSTTGSETSLGKVRRATEAQLAFFKKNSLFFKIFLHETRGFEWNIEFKLGSKLMARYRRHVRFLSQIFKTGIANDEFSDNLSPQDMAIALQGMINAFLTHWNLQRRSGNVGQDASLILDIFLGGVLRRAPDDMGRRKKR